MSRSRLCSTAVQTGNPQQARQVVTAGASPVQGHAIADHFVTSPSITKKFGPTGTLYRSVSLVRSRTRPNSSQPEFVTTREPKLAKVSASVQWHMFSYNVLPITNGKSGFEFLQFVSTYFFYPSVPDLTLDFVHNKILELHVNAPAARVNLHF